MIHEFTIKSDNINVVVHISARTREKAVQLLKNNLFNKNIKLEISENCTVSMIVKDIDKEIATNEIIIPLQQEPSDRKKNKSGRYFSVRESFIGRSTKTTPPEELSSDVPEDDEEVTKPDNPVAIRRSSHKMKAIKWNMEIIQKISGIHF